MTKKIGYVQGTCPVCGRSIIRKRPAKVETCDCYRYCPICTPAFTVLMTPFAPDRTINTYRNEEAGEVKGQGAGSPDWTLDTLYVCNNHSPPYYSKQKPVEVHLE